MNEKYDRMVIVAHPDDAEFGVGGTVACWRAAGLSVIYVLCTNGDKGTSDRNMQPAELAAIRKEEQLEAARELGVGRVVFLDHEDQKLEDTSPFREEIVRQIRRYRPEIVATSDPYRRYVWHRDHRIIGQVVLDAAFPYARDHMAYPAMLQEGLEPHKIRELWFFGADEANHYVDIESTFDKKVAALRCHRSQVREFGVRDLEKWLRARYQKLATGTDYALAEAFHRVVMPD